MRQTKSRFFTGLVAVAALLLAAGPAPAQEADRADHAATAAEIDGAVVERVEARAADRAAIRRVLMRTEVRELARTFGIDIRRVESASRTLEGEDLARVASLARDAEAALVGGDAIVISTTALIIALLVLIVILVA